jgi:hypothetical protein
MSERQTPEQKVAEVMLHAQALTTGSTLQRIAVMQREALGQRLRAQQHLGNVLFRSLAFTHGAMPSLNIRPYAKRRLTSPKGRNPLPHLRGDAVAACPDDRAFCPADRVGTPSERNHADTHWYSDPVGKEADPRPNRNPPLTHRRTGGGANRLPDSELPRLPTPAQEFPLTPATPS